MIRSGEKSGCSSGTATSRALFYQSHDRNVQRLCNTDLCGSGAVLAWLLPNEPSCPFMRMDQPSLVILTLCVKQLKIFLTKWAGKRDTDVLLPAFTLHQYMFTNVDNVLKWSPWNRNVSHQTVSPQDVLRRYMKVEERQPHPSLVGNSG